MEVDQHVVLLHILVQSVLEVPGKEGRRVAMSSLVCPSHHLIPLPPSLPPSPPSLPPLPSPPSLPPLPPSLTHLRSTSWLIWKAGGRRQAEKMMMGLPSRSAPGERERGREWGDKEGRKEGREGTGNRISTYTVWVNKKLTLCLRCTEWNIQFQLFRLRVDTV